MPKGIHNPFEGPKKKKKKKKEFKSSLEYANTESGIIEEPKATFDCGTHVITIHGVKSVKAATRKLVETFKVLRETCADHLVVNGIRMCDLDVDTLIVDPTELKLETKAGYLIVNTGHDTHDEDGAVRRLADTLLRLPGGKDVLKQHKVEVYKRA